MYRYLMGIAGTLLIRQSYFQSLLPIALSMYVSEAHGVQESQLITAVLAGAIMHLFMLLK